MEQAFSPAPNLGTRFLFPGEYLVRYDAVEERMKILYTAAVTATGARHGRVESSGKSAPTTPATALAWPLN